MLENETKKRYLIHFLNAKNVLAFSLWFFVGLVIYFQFGHLEIIFPFLIFLWILFGFLGLAVLDKWRWQKYFVIPVVVIVISVPTIFLYYSYKNVVSEKALDEFISSTADGEVSAKFSVDEEDLLRLGDNVSKDYHIVGRDSFFEAYEWLVRFPNNTTYHIFLTQKSFRNWDVSVYLWD